jgi:hypothetical protein
VVTAALLRVAFVTHLAQCGGVVELRLEAGHDFFRVEWTTFRRRSECPKRFCEFLAALHAWTVLLGRVGLYFLMNRSSNNVLLPSRGHSSGCTLDFFLMCSLGHGNGKSSSLLDFLL